MEFSLMDSLLRPFKGNKYIEKFLIGGGFYLAALVIQSVNFFTNCRNLSAPTNNGVQENLIQSFKSGLFCTYSSPSGLILHLINFLLLAIPLGYIVYYVHNYLHNEENILPDWKNNIFSFFKKGLSIYLISFYYFVLMLIVLFITVTTFSVLYHIFGFVTRQQGSMLSGLIGMFISLIFTAVFPFVLCIYSENFKITNGLNIINVLRCVFKEFGKFMLCVLVCGILSLVYFVIDLIMRMIIIGAPVMSFTTLPMSLMLITPFVSVYIIARGRENIVRNEAKSQPDAFDVSKIL